MAMDAKDLKIESALGAHTNDGSTKYAQSATALQTNGNKQYHDIGSNSLAKVDVPIARPCAIIGPDRVVPPQSTSDAYLQKASVKPWPCTDNIYQFPPEYPHKPNDFPPTRNISPRQTFQENMQRIMVPPTYVSLKNNEDRVLKNTKPAEAKYCDVPYTISPINIEPKIIKSAESHVPNMNPAYPQPVPPQSWTSGSVNVRPLRPYGAHELYQYSEYPNYAGPRPISMIRPNRNVHEDMPPVYQDRFYPEANIRFRPYPSPKDRPHQQLHARYDYINNYPNTLHLHNPYVPHKYDLQKSLPPQPCPVYPPGPINYIDRRPTPNLERYQRSPNQQLNFNQPFSNQNIPSAYGLVPGNCLQNRAYTFSPDNTTKSMMQNRFYLDSNNARKYYPSSENMYIGDINRPQTMKNEGLHPSYAHMHAPPPHHMYRKDNALKGYEHVNLRNFEYPSNLNPVARFPLQFSPQTISISPDSNTSIDTTQILNAQEDCGYVSQSSTASVKSMESGFNKISSDVYRRHDTRFDASLFSKPSQKKDNSKDKKSIDVRQFLQMWNEGDDEGNDNNKEKLIQKDPSSNLDHIQPGKSEEQLYVLGLVNVPNEELDKYNHIQKISKLPENIKGYNNIEILNQFEKLVESPSVNHFNMTPPLSKQKDLHSIKNTVGRHNIEMLPRPISPLDVEAKISQSVIHKEVGCNFEIRPCSPPMMNVELATPVQNVLGERLIEKVINPVVPKSPMVHTLETNNISSSRNSPKVLSCKMVYNQYPSPNMSDTLKTNYCLQDLEGNSGVCLASLPRLDNDIELNFPEINQQFINANKLESVRMSSLQDLPVLNSENVENTNKVKSKLTSKQISEHLNSGSESDKEVSKLSKYRKHKRRSSIANESDVNVKQHMTLHRTDSVIIKNPENGKSHEEYSHGPFIDSNSISGEVSNPIKEPVISNTISNNDDVNNSINEKSKIYPPLVNGETAIDFSLNKNFEQENNNCLNSLNEKIPLESDKDKHMSTISENEINRQIDPLPHSEQNTASVEFNILQANSPPGGDFNSPINDAIANKEFTENVLNDKIDFQSIDDDNLILHETVITHSKRKDVLTEKESAIPQNNSDSLHVSENPVTCIHVDNNTVNTSLGNDIENQVLTYGLEEDSIIPVLPLVDNSPKISPISQYSEDSRECLKTSVVNVGLNNAPLHNDVENCALNDSVSDKSIVVEKLPISDLPAKDVSSRNLLPLSSDIENATKCVKPSNPNVSQSDTPLNDTFQKKVLDEFMVENPVVPEQLSVSSMTSEDVIPSENALQLSNETGNSLKYAKSSFSSTSETESEKIFNDYMLADVLTDKSSVDKFSSDDIKPSENLSKSSYKTENSLEYTKSSDANVCLTNSPLNFAKEELNQSTVEGPVTAGKLSLTPLSTEGSPLSQNNSPVISYDIKSPINVKSLNPKIVEAEITPSQVIEHKVLNDVEHPSNLYPKIDHEIKNGSNIDAKLDLISDKEISHVYMCNSVISSSLVDASNETDKKYDDESIENYVKTEVASKKSQIITDVKAYIATTEKENYTLTQEGDEKNTEKDFNKEFTTKCDNETHVNLNVTNTSECSILDISLSDDNSKYKNNCENSKTDHAIKDLEFSSIVRLDTINSQSLHVTSDNNDFADNAKNIHMENHSEPYVLNTILTTQIEPLNEECQYIQRQKKSYPNKILFKKELFSPWFQKLFYYTDGYCSFAPSGENKKNTEINSNNEIDFVHRDNINSSFSAKLFVKGDISESNPELTSINNEKSTEPLAYEITTEEDKHIYYHTETSSDNIEQIKAKLFNIGGSIDSKSFIERNKSAECSQELSEEQVDESKTFFKDNTHLDLKFNDDIIKKNSVTESLFTKQFRSRRSRTLKRSLSESAATEYSSSNSVKEDDDNNCTLKNKRTKLDLKIDSELLMPSQIIAESFTNFIQNNRRNSISTIYNEENVSFCIVFDNDCVLTEENEEDSQKVCYTEIPGDCLTAICAETETVNSVLSEGLTCEDIKELEYGNEFILQDMEQRTIEETWVEDVACMETVYSDDIAEDIVISSPSSVKSSESCEGKTDHIDYEYNSVNENEHTNKVMNIYGNQMCDDDAQLVEKLYRTPQMDVNKTLINRESHLSVQYNRYYDNVSLEEILSDSNIAETHSLLDDYSESPLSTTPKNCDSNYILYSASGGDIQRHEDKSKDLLCAHDLNNENLDDIPKIVERKLSHSEKKDHYEEQEKSCEIDLCESSCDNLVSYNNETENLHYTVSSSPEVSSTTPEEKSSAILLKIRRYKGTKISEINEMGSSFKRTHDQRYHDSSYGLSASRPLITKAAQKYIPPLKETIRDLKVKIHLPKQSLYKLQQLKKSKEEPKINTSHTKLYNKRLPQESKKKNKPKFEDVLKSIDEIQIKMHREKNKKPKQSIPKVIIKKNENGAHYASTEMKETYNPDLTGRKWQPWVFLEKSNFIDKMALKQKFKAIYSHRKQTYVLAESFKKYKSISNSKFVISHPNSRDSNMSSGKLKYTFKLKHN